MSADRLPDSPNLDQLKRQAKELLRGWQTAPPTGMSEPRLRDAQRIIAERYGFSSWDALRDHVETLRGRAPVSRRERPGIEYEHYVPDTIASGGAVTRERARQFVERGVSGLKLDPATPADALRYLAEIPTLERLDLSEMDALTDADLGFLAQMPQLTAISFARFGRTGDGAVALLAGKPRLSRLALGPGLTDAGVERLGELPALAAFTDANSQLSVSASRTLTDRALTAIGTLQGLVALDVHTSVFGSPLYTAAGAAHLKKMNALDSLNYHGRLMTDDVLREIAAIPNLRWLHAQDVASGDEGFKALGECRTLESLAVRFCAAVTDRGVAALATLPRLTRLNIGGRKLTDAALAPFEAAEALIDLSPPLVGDGAFVHIGRIPNLERLTNMYNRSTTDAATRHLEGHAALKWYGAYGTQITDDSLRVLARLPSIEHVELDNLFGITDEGASVLARAVTLRYLSIDTCPRVAGRWLDSAPQRLDAHFNPGDRDYAEFYRAETMMDYPELPMPEAVPRPSGTPTPSIVPSLACISTAPSFNALGLSLPAVGGRPRRAGVMTREPFTAPARIEMVVRPLRELRLVFGAHNRTIAFDETGAVVDPAPWFLRTDSDTGQPQPGERLPIADDEWTRVTIEIGETAQRLFVNGRLVHTWNGEFTRFRSRLALGPSRSGLSVQTLSITEMGSSGEGGRLHQPSAPDRK